MTPSNDRPPMQDPDRIDYHESPDISEVHAPTKREFSEPSANVTPLPMWLTGVCAAVMVWAGTYFGVFHGGLSGMVYNEYESDPGKLFAIPVKKGAAAAAGPAATQSLVDQGKAVYSNCAACHQPTGLGVAGVYPPLAKSEWVTGSEKRLVAVLLKGLQGAVTVEGKTYNGAMPAWEKTLSEKKIAAVASYIRASFGNQAPEISEAKVAAAKKEFAAQVAPYTEAEIMAIPADATLPDAAGGAKPETTTGTAPAASGAAPAGDQMADGKAAYTQVCMVCHQGTGLGLPPAFPPLAKTEYVTGDPKRFAAIVLKGVSGPITVDGKQFVGVMPPQEAALTDKKIAAILTYVRGSFGNTSPPVAVDVVASARKEFLDRKTPWTEAELKNLSGAAPTP